MTAKTKILINANEAVAKITYKTNEIFPIYPITPASPMSELVEEWSAKQHKNIFGNVPTAFEMQSEAGVAGTMQGALQTGALSSTFTASQGLLLMLPNMYKIAAELTPNVIHVATRSIATHALSIFGDHSDVMSARNTGYALLGSASVQEAMDMALIAQAATLKTRIPFLHFFDGFRTSHEYQMIENIPDGVISNMMDSKTISGHRKRALHPESPVIRGTSQAPDTFFQSREASNSYYDNCPELVQQTMNEFATHTGRQYKLFDYVGHPEAEKVIVSMASSTETIEEGVKNLNGAGEKVGLVKVRLYRPFSKKHLLNALPETTKKIAVLDRTKESGATGEPLFLDIVQAITEAFQNNEISYLPHIIGGRYGLSSKEFTPSMVLSVFKNLDAKNPIKSFTVGIEDDVTFKSLSVATSSVLKSLADEILIYGYKSDAYALAQQHFLNSFEKAEELYLQLYTEFDYKKSNARNVHNLRIAKQQIKAPYLIDAASLVICENIDFLLKDNALDRIKEEGTLVVFNQKEGDFYKDLPSKIQKKLQSKKIKVCTSGEGVDSIFEPIAVLFPIWNSGSDKERKLDLKLVEFSNENSARPLEEDNEFSKTFLGKLIAGEGNSIPVSNFPIDGTYPTNTSEFIENRNKGQLPEWNPEACLQCGLCSLACPQAAIRIKVYTDERLPKNANLKRTTAENLGLDFGHLNYTVQVNPEQCTSCNQCVQACDSGALQLKNTDSILSSEQENWQVFEQIPEFDRERIDANILAQQQLQEPLFKYSMGEDGCSQAPYLKLLSQLYGDQLLVANATGASSIFGGALPTTPWAKNKEGRGPSWANSLFEDNAEFGLGFQLSQLQLQKQAKDLLTALKGVIDESLVVQILSAEQKNDAQIEEQRKRIERLKSRLVDIPFNEAKKLLPLADYLVKRSVWIVGGDGWAYDIGFGGLDHVIATGENVNILVLDNQLYSNTGGQQSKATPLGAASKFGYSGKTKRKKDLGLLSMAYGDVYVASVAMGADPHQTLKAFKEAESYDGPSLIIAYCNSTEHGMDLRNSRKHQTAAVASGHWPLYRHDPRKGEEISSRYQWDTDVPNIRISEFYAMETRFQKGLETHPELIQKLQEDIDCKTNSHKRISSKNNNLVTII